MQKTVSSSSNDNAKAEFSPEEDKFSHVRTSSRRWILAHMLAGVNKYIIIVIFLGTILSSLLGSGLMVLIGRAIDEFGRGDSSNLELYAILFFVFAIGSPLLNLLTSLTRENLAQRIERDTRHEFYVSLLGKSQSFHESQRIGDIMARATNDVRMLNFMVSPGLSLMFSALMSLVIPILFVAIFYPTDLLLTPLLFTIFFALTLRGYIQQLDPVANRLRGEFGAMNAVLNETLSGIEVVKGSTTEEYELNRYYINAKGYRDAFVSIFSTRSSQGI